MPTVNIGTVSEKCDSTVPRDSCVHELADHACQLGADVIWGVAETDGPSHETLLSARAAHTK
jgi:hypothetical protein